MRLSTGAADSAAGHLIPAAEYVRMSTDHQRYSPENQSIAIREYASRKGMQVVRTYADLGKSGLDIGRRDALKCLIEDIQSGYVEFRVVLVYDISRWGRFQDADESAYYEYLCTSAGIKVIYCAEKFENDGTPVAAMIKSLKRAMAGEYSRELSKRTSVGHRRLGAKGFRQGSYAGYGLRRELFDENGISKGFLRFGERKSILTDRVRLAPGPDFEVRTVSRIYKLFVQERLSEAAIATLLNSEGIIGQLGNSWTRDAIRHLLTSEKYIGNYVYNRVTAKLHQPRTLNPPENLIRCDGAWKGIVSPALFFRAREIIADRTRRIDNAKMLDLLKGLRDRYGRLSSRLINDQDDMPSSYIYKSRFGSLLHAYELIGHRPGQTYQHREMNKNLQDWRPSIVSTIVESLVHVGARVERTAKTDLLTINNEWTASIVPVRCLTTKGGNYRWIVRFDKDLSPDMTIVIRMDRSNRKAMDYYCVPRIDLGYWPRKIAAVNEGLIDTYRFNSLDFLFELAGRSPLMENT